MLKNFVVTAIRNLRRSKGSAFINISGLTLGITASLILFLLVRHQSSFDNYHTKLTRIYRVVHQSDGNQGKNYTSGVPPVLPEAFQLDFPEAEEVVFTSYRAGGLITIPQSQGVPKKYEEDKGIVYMQPNFFKIFDRKVLIGDAPSGLDDPGECVVSEQAALKYFGKQDARGEVLSFNGQEFKIVAIVEDYPDNTDFPFNVMLSYITIKSEKDKSGWHSIWSDEHCYFLLKQESAIAEIERRIPDFVTKHHGENRDHATYEMQPLSEIHFDDRYGNYNYSTTSRQMITSLTVIGIFLIITACINFINLVTAEAIKRSKEVGIRKTLGSSRAQLIFQFIGESSIITIFSVLLAVAVAQFVLVLLNSFIDSNLSLNFSSDEGLWIFLVTTTIVVALLSGIYPSVVVSGFKPVFAIKNGVNSKNSSGFLLRRGLVVLQFFISQFFIIGTIVLISQMNYFRNKELGFEKDAVITIPIPENDRRGFTEGASKMRTLREEVSRVNGIELTTLSNTPPSSGSVSATNFSIEGREENFGTQVKLVDGNYVELYGLELLAGVNILDLDTARGFLVNEKLASMVGFNDPQEIIGTTIKMWGQTLPVVGVIKNFHTMSLHEPIEATILLNRIRDYSTLSIKINPVNLQETIKEVQQRWEAAYSEHIFSYKFLDEEIKEFYEREEKMSTLLTIFTCIAIFIGCLGLFGLATFMANQKTKEIGVRKVLGASVQSIVLLFSKEYIKLILIGFALAAPLAWYVMGQWLNDFAYKIDIGPAIFIIGLGASFLIAMITVGYRSIRAATVNPVDSLKCE
ncbi:MAG: ABC transporter permease [Bacteroidia bacterium]|nr:ABC transporter permease [Bacteroidia bacterium]